MRITIFGNHRRLVSVAALGILLCLTAAAPARAGFSDAVKAQTLPNGLRVLVRIGWGRLQKSYTATYRSVQEDLKPDLPKGVDNLKEAHLLLRQHGKTLCKDAAPICDQCPLAMGCDYAQKNTRK